MSKQEKYIRFVIDSMIKNTTYENGEVKNVPFPHIKRSNNGVMWMDSQLRKWIKEKYGARDTEIDTIVTNYHRINRDKYQ